MPIANPGVIPLSTISRGIPVTLGGGYSSITIRLVAACFSLRKLLGSAPQVGHHRNDFCRKAAVVLLATHAFELFVDVIDRDCSYGHVVLDCTDLVIEARNSRDVFHVSISGIAGVVVGQFVEVVFDKRDSP